MKTTVILAGILSVSLSACGGGGGGEKVPATQSRSQTTTPQTQPAQPPAAADSSKRTVKIAMYGDSTTAGAQTLNGVLFQTQKNEPAILQAALQAKYGKDANVTIYNEGVGGTEAAQLLYGTDGKHQPFGQEMAKSDADIVVLNFGDNDSFYYAKPVDGIMPESVGDYWGLMSQLAQIARSYGKTVVFQEPGPQCNFPAPGAPIYGYVSVLRQVADQIDVPLVAQFDYMQALPDWKALVSEDCVHPTDAGYAVKAAQTLAVVSPIVAQLLKAGGMVASQ